MLNEVKISMGCVFCGQEHSVVVDEVDYYDWHEGKLAQCAFPYLNPTQREQLISHICPKCQASIYG